MIRASSAGLFEFTLLVAGATVPDGCVQAPWTGADRRVDRVVPGAGAGAVLADREQGAGFVAGDAGELALGANHAAVLALLARLAVDPLRLEEKCSLATLRWAEELPPLNLGGWRSILVEPVAQIEVEPPEPL